MRPFSTNTVGECKPTKILRVYKRATCLQQLHSQCFSPSPPSVFLPVFFRDSHKATTDQHSSPYHHRGLVHYREVVPPSRGLQQRTRYHHNYNTFMTP